MDNAGGNKLPSGSALETPFSNGQRFTLRLYVAGSSVASRRAIATARSVCATHLEGRHDLEVIDIYQQPELASRDQIFAVPALLRLTPRPLKALVGDLSDREKVLRALGLTAAL